MCRDAGGRHVEKGLMEKLTFHAGPVTGLPSVAGQLPPSLRVFQEPLLLILCPMTRLRYKPQTLSIRGLDPVVVATLQESSLRASCDSWLGCLFRLIESQAVLAPRLFRRFLDPILLEYNRSQPLHVPSYVVEAQRWDLFSKVVPGY